MHSFGKFSAALALAAFATAAQAQLNLPNPLSSKEKESLSKTDINLIRAVDTKLGNSTFGNCATKVVREMSFPKHKQKGKPVDQVFSF